MFARRNIFACGLAATLAFAAQAPAQYVPGSLISYWPLDETNAAVAVTEDISGNDNEGTLRTGQIGIAFPAVNGPGLVSTGPTINSVTKDAAAFDGSNDVLFVPDDAALNFDKTKGTISLWLNVNFNDRMSILRIADDGPFYPGYSNSLSLEKTGSTHGNRVFFYPNLSQGYFMVEHAPVAGNWEHYVFSWDYTAADSGDATNPNRVKAWVNGVAQTNRTAGGGSGDATFTTAPTDTGDWIFGQRFLDASTTQRPFAGRMAEIAIFDDVVDDAGALALFNTGVNTSDPNLVSHWDMSNGVTTSISNSVSGAPTMLTSEPTEDRFPAGIGPEWAAAQAASKPAYIDRALNFAGASGDPAQRGLFSVPDSASLAFDKSKGSIVMWAYFAQQSSESVANRTGILGDESGNIVAQISSSGRVAFRPNSASNNEYLTDAAQGGAIPVNQWRHLAFVWDIDEPDSGDVTLPNKVKVYIDGVRIPCLNSSSFRPDANFTAAGTTTDWVFGRRHLLTDDANPRWHNGQYADIAIFDVPLTATDVDDIFNDGVAAFVGPLDSDPPTSSATIADAAQLGASVSVDFTADDGAGSGVDSVALWVRTPSSGTFVDSGLTETGTAGTFVYTAADGNGLYEFFTIATDNAANEEDPKTEAEAEIAVSLAANTAVPLPFSATRLSRVFPMEANLFVTITLDQIGTDGTITVSRTIGNQAPAGYNSDMLIGQHWTIATGGGFDIGAGSATIVFDYDGTLFGSDLTDASQIDIVLADDGGNVTAYQGGDIDVDGTEETITVLGVDTFSDWYAGNSASNVRSWMILED